MVKERGEFENASSADPSPGRLQSRHPVCGCRQANGAACICAERPVAKAGRGGDARSARRGAGPKVWVPRIEWRFEHRWPMLGVSALGQFEIAENNRAGVAKALDHHRVLLGYVVTPERHSRRRFHPSDIEKIFNRNRDSMKRAAVSTLRDFSFGGTRLR